MNSKIIWFLNLLNKTDLVTIDNGPYLSSWDLDTESESHDENQVVCFSWESEGEDYYSILTESGITNGTYYQEDSKFVCEDHEGKKIVICLFKLQKINMKSEVQVKHWDLYNSASLEDGEEYYNSHVMKVDDQRESNGKMFIDIQCLQNEDEDIMSVTAEIHNDPRTRTGNLPCLHVHFNDNRVAASLFKIGHRILVRPETDVTIEPVQFRIGENGPIETFYWIE